MEGACANKGPAAKRESRIVIAARRQIVRGPSVELLRRPVRDGLFVFTRLSPIFFDCTNIARKFELGISRTYFPGGALDDEPAGVAGGAERADFGVLK